MSEALEGEILLPEQSPSNVLFQPSPFQQGAVRMLRVEPGTRLSELPAKIGASQRLARHLQILIGDDEVPPALWHRVKLKAGAPVYVRVRMAGGGGIIKNILRVVLFIGIAVATIVTFGAALPAAGLAGATLGQLALAGLAAAAVSTAGTLLINTLIPPPRPRSNSAFDSSGNPYNALTAVSNRFAPYAPIPRVFGRRRIYPILAARPYTEHEGRTQYLRMLLLCGYGPLKLSEIRIGNTPVTAFQGVEVEVREGWPTDPPVTLFTRSVREEGLQILLAPNAPVVRATETATTEVSIDVTWPLGLFDVGSKGRRDNRTIDVRVEYSANANGPWTLATWVEGRRDYGTAVNGRLQARDASADPVVRSGRFRVPSPGIWQVRLTRTTVDNGNDGPDDTYWTVLRSIANDTPVQMPGLALIALRLKATEQLSGVPDQINVLAESYHEVYDPQTQTWAWEITRNPAWHFCDALRRRGTRALIPATRIDLTRIVDWASVCEATAPNASEPRWTHDFVYEGGSVFTAAREIASYGRAQFSIIDGQYSVVRDAPQTVPIQHISPRNSSNYQGSKAFLEAPHAFRARFRNRAAEDADDEVIVYRDGYDASNTTEIDTLEFPGASTSTQAWREARYHLANLLLRPEEHRVTMDVEALRCTLGDLVQFSHDVVSIGLGTGRIVGRVESGGNVTGLMVDSPVDLAAGKTYALRVRRRNGASQVLALTGTGTALATLTLAVPVALASAPAIGDLWQFGESTLESAPMIVKRIDPAPDFQFTLTLVDAAAGVHTADTGTIPAFQTLITRPEPIEQAQPQTPSLSLRSDGDAAQRLGDGTLIETIIASITPPLFSDVSAARWEVEWKLYNDDSDRWMAAGSQPVSVLSLPLAPALVGKAYDVRARFVSAAGVPGPWALVLNHTVTGYDKLPPDVTGFAATAAAEQVELRWTEVEEPSLAHYEIRRGTSWEAGVAVAQVGGSRVIVGNTAANTFWIKAVTRLGAESANAASVAVTPAITPGALLDTRFQDALSAANAAFAEAASKASATSVATLTSDFNAVRDAVTSPTTGNSALSTAISQEAAQRTSGDNAISASLNTLSAEVAGARGGTASLSARTAQLDQARVDGDTALATRADALEATVNTGPNRNALLSSRIGTVETATTDGRFAQASSVTLLEARLRSPNPNLWPHGHWSVPWTLNSHNFSNGYFLVEGGDLQYAAWTNYNTTSALLSFVDIPLPAEPYERHYTLSALCYAQNLPEPGFYLEARNGSGSLGVSGTVYWDATRARRSVTFLVPANTTTLRIVFYVAAGARVGYSDMVWRDMQLEVGSEASPYNAAATLTEARRTSVDAQGRARAITGTQTEVNGRRGGMVLANDGSIAGFQFDVDYFWLGRPGVGGAYPFRFANNVLELDDATIRNLLVSPSSGATARHRVALRPNRFSGADGAVISYGGAYEGLPLIQALPHSLAAPPAGAAYDIRAVNVTATSFQVRARQLTPGARTAQTATGGVNVGGTPQWRMHKPTVADANDGNYVFQFDVRLPFQYYDGLTGTPEAPPSGGQAVYGGAVELWARINSVWTKIRTEYIEQYNSSDVYDWQTSANISANIGQTTDYEFAIHPVGSVIILAFDAVRYNTQTTSNETVLAGNFSFDVYAPT